MQSRKNVKKIFEELSRKNGIYREKEQFAPPLSA